VPQEPQAGGKLLSLPKPELSRVVDLAALEVQAHAIVLNRNNANVQSKLMRLSEITAMDAYQYLPLPSLKGMIWQIALVEDIMGGWQILTFQRTRLLDGPRILPVTMPLSGALSGYARKVPLL
jgi:hypothetical protein